MFMTESIWQCSLLAQGDDAGEWMNILFIVVVAVFWAIGGIVKAAGAGRPARRQPEKRSSAKGTSRRETWLQQLARKAEEIQRAVENQGKPQPQRPQERPPQAKPSKPPAGQVTVRTGPGGQSVLVYERQAKSAAAQWQEQQTRKRRERSPASRIRARTVQETRQRPTPSSPEISAAPAVSRRQQPLVSEPHEAMPAVKVRMPLVDYSDVDALKRAILHYEILGKPLAFRDPLERIAPF